MTFIGMALALLCAIALAGCAPGYTRVREIKAAPEGFTGKEVRLRGIVGRVTDPPRANAFLLRDGSGEIMVVTTAGLPPENSEVALTGIVKMTVIQGVRWTLDVRVDETQRLR